MLHLFALVMPAGIFYIPQFFPQFSGAKFIAPVILAVVLTGSIIIEFLRFRVPAVQKIFYLFVGSMLREEESKKTTGSTFVIGAALMCSLLFWHHLHIAFMVLFIFILGDAVAALVGISMGRIKIGKKSLEGSTACFLMCMLLFFAVFPFVPGLFDTWGGGISLKMALIAIMVSLSTTVFELVPLKISSKIIINDNLAVPVISGFLMLGLERMLGF